MRRVIIQHGDVTLLTASGTLAAHELLISKEEFGALLDDGQRKFVFDLTKLHHLGSSSLGALLQCRKLALEHGASIRVVVSPPQKDLLEITRLDRVLEAYTDKRQALLSFVH